MNASTKRRSKKYRPRPVDPDGGLSRIALCVARGINAAPLTGAQLTDLGAAYWLSFEQLRTGEATEEVWSCVVCALNIGLALAEQGIGDEFEQTLIAALEGAFRAKVRSARTGNFRLDGEAMRAIGEALHVHDAQMEIATRVEVTAAMRLVHDRIEQGNVYQAEQLQQG
jgi:hypothetical protein